MTDFIDGLRDVLSTFTVCVPIDCWIGLLGFNNIQCNYWTEEKAFNKTQRSKHGEPVWKVSPGQEVSQAQKSNER